MKRMKRLAAMLLTLCLLATMLPTSAQATSESDLTFALNSDGLSYYVSDCNASASGSLEIPANFDGKPVTRIGDYAFYFCDSLTSITIPDSVTCIGDYAFAFCGRLSNVTIPDSVNSIGEEAFNACDNLSGIWVDEENTCYSSDQFGVLFNKNKTELLRVPQQLEGTYMIPESVVSIRKGAFYNCYCLINVEISKNVREINAGAFEACFALDGIWVDENNPNYSSDSDGVLFNKNKSVLIFAPGSLEDNYAIPDGVTAIEESSFGSCYRLVDVTIPDSVITIGRAAFYFCYSLKNVNIGSGVTTIGTYAFKSCDNLTSITIPDSVTSIGDEAFSVCGSLTNITIPDSVTSIGNSAFYYCDSLTSITIPDSVTSIGTYAFYNCYALTNVCYYGTEEQRELIDIKSGNDDLINANWKYTVGGPVYSDVVATSWQYNAVNYAVENGLMAGKGKDQYGRIVFDPNKAIPREEFVQVLYNAESKPSVAIANKFPDVKNEWYKNAVLWANAKNIASGLGDGRFGVGKNIARQDLAVMLYKYAKMKDCDLTATAGKIAQFADGNKVSGYAKTAMDWAVTKGVLSGKGVIGEPISTFKLDPTGTATRAECAAMLKNFMEAQDTPDTPETPVAPAMTAVLTGVEADSIQYYNCKESGNFAVIEKKGKYGIIGYEGETLLPVEYDEIYQGRGYGYDYLWASKGDYFYSIDDNGRAEESWGYPGGDVDPDAYWYNDQLVVFLPGTGEGIIGGLEKLSWIAVEQRPWKENAVLPIREMVDITEDKWGQKFPKIENKSFALLDTTTGKLVSDFIYSGFDTGNGFSEGILAVKKGDKWGFVDEKGNEVTDFLYDPYEQNDVYEDMEYKYSLFTAVNGYIAVLKDGKWGLLDTQGNTVLEAVYDGISQVNPDGMFWLKENGTWTLYQLGGK